MTNEQQRLKLTQDQTEQLGEGVEADRMRQTRSSRDAPASTPLTSDPINDLMKRDLVDLPKSSIEEIFRGRFPTEVSRELQQFGYDLFNNKPSSFTPFENVPVSDDYVVGPGDVFTINVWGSPNFSYTVTVKRDGTIFIPKIGSIKVWGQSFKEMSRTVRTRLSTFLSGIKVEIALETIRMIDVFVIGEVL